MTQKLIYTGIRFFGHRIYLERTKDPILDAALKRVFVKDFNKSGPLEMCDADVQACLKAKGLKERG